ncbi:MAG: serine hydrolase [Mycobacterium sp.]
MRTRPSTLTKAVATISCAALVASSAGCEARVYGSPGDQSDGPMLTVVAAPRVPLDATPPLAPPDQPEAAFDGLQVREQQATSDAADDGADITVAVLDRDTGQLVTNGRNTNIAIASVVKLFIADDLLLQVSQGKTTLTPADQQLLDVMLRSSDDSAAETFWNRSGKSAIINRVVARYGLGSTRPPSNGRWFNTISTATDLVRYYDMLISGAGGLPSPQANVMLNDLAQSTPTAPDGMVPGGVYPQRFGIPEGIPGEPVAVKQGWMCCIGSDWMHLSTGVIGTDRRYVMAISSMQPTSATAARATITQAVKTIFPAGRI